MPLIKTSNIFATSCSFGSVNMMLPIEHTNVLFCKCSDGPDLF